MLQWTCQFRRGRWLKKEIKREPTVHFDEQLIERLICLRVSPEVRSGSLAPYSVDLVDEKNAGSVLASLLEHPAHLEITPGWFRVSNAGSDPSHLSRPGGGGKSDTKPGDLPWTLQRRRTFQEIRIRWQWWRGRWPRPRLLLPVTSYPCPVDRREWRPNNKLRLTFAYK